MQISRYYLTFFSAASTLVASLLFSSCGYTEHMPQVPVDSHALSPLVKMKVGERSKVMSKQIFSEFSMGFLMPPSFYLKSSNPKVIRIDGAHPRVAWVEALQVGKAAILYRSGHKTPIEVTR